MYTSKQFIEESVNRFAPDANGPNVVTDRTTKIADSLRNDPDVSNINNILDINKLVSLGKDL
ncbi:MAG: hypothetical protein KAS32_31120 [Candidatus Peribacteraceae bacterium]|nr:hypothetical protein [Candidatus Peribacteraceae bacterium]